MAICAWEEKDGEEVFVWVGGGGRGLQTNNNNQLVKATLEQTKPKALCWKIKPGKFCFNYYFLILFSLRTFCRKLCRSLAIKLGSCGILFFRVGLCHLLNKFLINSPGLKPNITFP